MSMWVRAHVMTAFKVRWDHFKSHRFSIQNIFHHFICKVLACSYTQTESCAQSENDFVKSFRYQELAGHNNKSIELNGIEMLHWKCTWNAEEIVRRRFNCWRCFSLVDQREWHRCRHAIATTNGQLSQNCELLKHKLFSSPNSIAHASRRNDKWKCLRF